MTLAQVFASSSGLNSLTALNKRLIAEFGDPTPPASEDDFWDTGSGEVADPDADEGDGDAPDPFEIRGRFATENPLEFNRVKEWLEATVFAGISGMSPMISSFVNEWGVEWADRTGTRFAEGAPFPTLEQLMEEDDFINGAVWLPLTANNAIPPVFESTAMTEEGEQVAVIAIASPLTGVEFVTEQELPTRRDLMFEMARRGSDIAVRAVRERFLAGRTPIDADLARARQTTSPEAARMGLGRRTGGGSPNDINLDNFVRQMAPAPGVAGQQLPSISQEALLDALNNATSRGPGGGGGGGGTRRDIVFDRNHLIAQVADVWRSWMFDPNDPPNDWIASNVDGYIKKARAFWSGKGGQLDFDTYIKDRIRQHDRYKTIFEWKTPNETEEQFIARFAQPIAQLGQSGEFTREQTEAALTSGASPMDQLNRIRRTREVQNSGGFSQRLAQTLQSVAI